MAPAACWAAAGRSGRPWRIGAVAVVAVAFVAAVWVGTSPEPVDEVVVGDADDRAVPDRVVTSSTTALSTVPATAPPATTQAPPVPPPTEPPAPPPSYGAAWEVALASIVVAPEGSRSGYDRDLFEHWTDDDGDGCDTRCEVLRREQRSDLPGLASGWWSAYDGYTTDDPGELDVDHVVALAEAWDSGAAGWDPARRRAFANDLDTPGALLSVTAATNRSKSDRDPAEWQPPNRDAWCAFGTGWVRTKAAWGLTADPAEVAALRNMLRGCP